MEYVAFFRKATQGLDPYPYQAQLATESWPDLLNVPTGLGKTAAVSLAWLWKRGWRPGGERLVPDEHTPRRLIWCLPMRVLVEQTAATLRIWLDQLGVRGGTGDRRVSVHVLMGGEPNLKAWAERPEEDMIVVGTQDMLLSRALMRGYGVTRYQWPVHFALLHNDSLWAFDEVQLMGVGLATSAQLEAFRRRFPLGRQSRSLWLSATLNPAWLATVDLAPHLEFFRKLELSQDDRLHAGDRLNADKRLHRAAVSLSTENAKKDAAEYLKSLCNAVLEAHDPSAQTLVILNRVDRAQGLFRRLRAQRPQAADLLIHARFRLAEREAAQTRMGESPGTDRIVIATQAIEAGVDISSKVLFTELAPWASLVQRLGRCNRYGEYNGGNGAAVFWIDIAEEADPLPYDADSLTTARSRLARLTQVGPAKLPPIDDPRPLTPMLRRKDLLDLFNTDPDLSGFDVDVSDYIRDSGTPGLRVFWRDVSDPNDPEPQQRPTRDELCPVSMTQARTLAKRSVWWWDALSGRWESLKRMGRPGMTLMLAAKEGGYDSQLGFTTGAKGFVTPVGPVPSDSQERYDSDWRSATFKPVALREHLGHVAGQAAALCEAVGETAYRAPIIRAGRWHDVGKLHEIFQRSMHRCDSAPGGYLAKSNCLGPMRHGRRYFRHELASTLAWLAQHDVPDAPDSTVDLIAYLIAAHHGKVRMSLRAMPDETPAPSGARFARGIWEGDKLPAFEFDGESSSEFTLRLALMELGDGEQGRSWTKRVVDLLDKIGPFHLAWLEILVRIADWRASAVEQEGTDEE